MNTPLKYPGAKWSYAKWITSFFPPHKMFLEPYFGSGAVFFAKDPAVYETINDMDGMVVNFFKACRDYPEELARVINLTPWSRQEYRQIEEDSAGEEIKFTGDCVEDARRFCIRCNQGFGSKLADRVGWKNTKHSAGPINPRLWSRVPDYVLDVGQRLKNTQIEQTDAIQLIEDCDGSDCLIYADPPYLGYTRKNKRIYRYEMMDEERHVQMLKVLLNHKGPVILSGYDNDLYNGMLSGWHKETMIGYANSSAKRTETLWMNFEHQVRFAI